MSLCIRTFIHLTARLDEDLLNWPKTEGKIWDPELFISTSNNVAVSDRLDLPSAPLARGPVRSP